MGVMMKAFYWDCPREEGQEFTWWNHVVRKLDELKKAGITDVWLPPASKGSNPFGQMSMGYDVYDYYDLGIYDQKGSVKTWFGSESELKSLINAAHGLNLKVYADLALNYNGGANEEELNPILQQKKWTLFRPASNIFTRDWTCFTPSPYDRDCKPFGFGHLPSLCHLNPRVASGILEHVKWMVEKIGFDGFHYNNVKQSCIPIVRAIHEQSYSREHQPVDIFGFGVGMEHPDCEKLYGEHEWIELVNMYAQHRVGSFDSKLRDQLKELCDNPGNCLENLSNGDFLFKERPMEAVTFVENQEFRNSPNISCEQHPEIINDKILAYAFILTHEGYPCVYWKDWFTYGLAESGKPCGIERLVQIHESHAGGGTNILYVDDGLYVMERTGFGTQPGLIFALNDSEAVITQTIKSGFKGKTLQPLAWRANVEMATPQILKVSDSGSIVVTTQPRGYTVWGLSNNGSGLE